MLVAVVAMLASVAACTSPLSTLTPAGSDAIVIDALFRWMAAGAAAVVVASIVALFYALGRRRPVTADAPAVMIAVGGGLLVVSVWLASVMARAMPEVPGLVDGPEAAAGDLRVHIGGEQWWWRVRYDDASDAVELANELRLPAGRTAHLTLSSDNVIHAFWVPALGGKIDVIPGRETFLTLEPTVIGRYRGLCAEFCGASHARMGIEVVVEPPDVFAAWLDRQRDRSATPSSAAARTGAEVFQQSGCGGCHRVRGTPASGVIGPDLTHVASRAHLAAWTLPNDPVALARWLQSPQHLKPGALMPPFDALDPSRRDALVAFLGDLR